MGYALCSKFFTTLIYIYCSTGDISQTKHSFITLSNGTVWLEGVFFLMTLWTQITRHLQVHHSEHPSLYVSSWVWSNFVCQVVTAHRLPGGMLGAENTLRIDRWTEVGGNGPTVQWPAGRIAVGIGVIYHLSFCDVEIRGNNKAGVALSFVFQKNITSFDITPGPTCSHRQIILGHSGG